MDRIEVLRAYTRLVEQGSFSAVARELRVTQSTVSKWLSALESELDTQLIERTTRAMHVTDAGRRFHLRALAVLEAYDSALDSVHEDPSALRGRIRISVPEVFGRLHVVPHVARFVQRHPGIAVDLMFADRYVNLVEEGFDLAIRIGRSADSMLRAQALGSTDRCVVASPGYVRRRGAPSTPDDLYSHDCLSHSSVLGNTWSFTRGGRTNRVPVRGRITANNSEATLALARRGLGIGLLARWLTEPDVRAGRLVPLLEDYVTPTAKIRALTPPGRHGTPRVRAMIEHLRDALAGL